MNKDQIQSLMLIEKYKQEVVPMLKLSFPMLSDREINEAIDYSIVKRMKNPQVILDNNYKNKTLDTTLVQMAEYILSKEPIMTAAGVLFRKHSELPNPIRNLIQGFMDNRGIYKNKMFEYPKGSEMYEKYNLLQLLSKVDANALKM